MPAIDAFVAIEETMAEALTAGWVKRGTAVVKTVRSALRQGDVQQAADTLSGVKTLDLAARALPRIEELGASALLLGAAQLTPLGRLEREPLPPVLPLAAAQVVAIAGQAEELIQKRGHAVLAEWERAHDRINKAEFDLADALNAAVLGTGKELFDLSANLTTSRLVSFGFLAQARKQQVTTYQLNAVLDHRTSAICRRLHGRTFQVEQASALIDQALRVTNPGDLKAVHPWLRGTKQVLHDLEHLSDSQLTERYGVLVPPFHPRCRTTLAKVGTVTTQASFTPVDLPVPSTVQLALPDAAPTLLTPRPAPRPVAVEPPPELPPVLPAPAPLAPLAPNLPAVLVPKVRPPARPKAPEVVPLDGPVPAPETVPLVPPVPLSPEPVIDALQLQQAIQAIPDPQIRAQAQQLVLLGELAAALTLVQQTGV